MTADLLDGKRVASEIRIEVADKVRQFVQAGGPQPCLTAVLVGEDPASQVYVRNKSRACEKAGIDGRTMRLDAGISQQELVETVQKLNDDPSVHGILVQLPLPAHGNVGQGFDERAILDTVTSELEASAGYCENQASDKGYAIKTATREIADHNAAISDAEATLEVFQRHLPPLPLLWSFHREAGLMKP